MGMTQAQTVAYRFRWALLVSGLALTTPGVLWVVWPGLKWFGLEELESVGLIGTPVAWVSFITKGHRGFMWNGGVLLGIVLVAQWAFLRPCRGLTISLTKQGRPMTSAVLAAAMMAMFLTLGLLATLLECLQWWDDWTHEPVWMLQTGMAVVWVAWAIVFAKYWRDGDRYTQLSRMIRGLLAGSVLNVIVATPVQALSAKDCYCARGSYTGLVLGGTVIFWLFGPGIVLLFLREKYRVEKHLCVACGYDLRGTIRAGKSECPECGQRVVTSEPTRAPSA